MKLRIIGIALVSVYFMACQSSEQKDYILLELPLATQHSGEPNLFVSAEGRAYLSWVEYLNDSTDNLVFSTLENDLWSEPKSIAVGSDWFVNWADFPSLISIDQDHMVAHWLQKSATGTYDYDVRMTHSIDGGNNWSPSMVPHRDSINAEHGFVTLLPTPQGNTFATWLDGRNTKNETNNAMTLRTAEIGPTGELINEAELDNRVCDCCQTGATWTEKGPIVVYRDRSDDEIRDIGIVRKVDNVWTKPTSLHGDNWKIAGCPVNGPAIDSNGKFVSIAWFTMSGEESKVLFSRSDDYGEHFSEPIRLDDEAPMGRVDLVQMKDGRALVSFMENQDSSAVIKIKEIGNEGKVKEAFLISQNSASRKSGFPRIALIPDNGLVVAWTDARQKKSMVKSAKIQLNNE